MLIQNQPQAGYSKLTPITNHTAMQSIIKARYNLAHETGERWNEYVLTTFRQQENHNVTFDQCQVGVSANERSVIASRVFDWGNWIYGYMPMRDIMRHATTIHEAEKSGKVYPLPPTGVTRRKVKPSYRASLFDKWAVFNRVSASHNSKLLCWTKPLACTVLPSRSHFVKWSDFNREEIINSHTPLQFNQPQPGYFTSDLLNNPATGATLRSAQQRGLIQGASRERVLEKALLAVISQAEHQYQELIRLQQSQIKTGKWE